MTAREIITRTRESGGFFVLTDDGGFTLRNANRVSLAVVAEIRAHRDEIREQLLLAYAHTLPERGAAR
jgi:hypothetical protein